MYTSINQIERVTKHTTALIIGYRYTDADTDNTFTVITEDGTEYKITEDRLQPLFPSTTSLKDTLQEHLPIQLEIELQGKTIINVDPTLADPGL